MKRSVMISAFAHVALWTLAAGSAPTVAGAARATAPAAAPLVIELESIISTATLSGGDLIVQPMAGFGPGWGGDAQLFWRAPAPVEPIRALPHLSVPLTLPPGTYDIVLYHTVAPDYGDFSVLLAGEEVADVEGHATTVGLRQQSLGRRSLTGEVQIRFTVFGKQPTSSGFIVGLDRLELRPAAAGVASGGSAGRDLASAPRGASMPRAAAIFRQALARPTLEVFSEGRGFGTQGVRLNWTAPVLRPRFRWQPAGTGATAANWEASTTPFPSNPGRPAAGLLASGRVALTPDASTGEFEIDLVSYAPRRGRLKTPNAAPPPDPGIERPYVFVRLRATDSSGAFVGQPSDPITLFFGRPGKLKLPPQANLPRLRLVSYQPPRPYTWDFQCHGRAVADVYFLGQKMIAKDQKGNLCKKKDKDFWDHFEDAVGSIVDLVSSAVDWAATAYKDIKSTATGVVVDGLKASGIGCGSECQFAVGVALDAGLAAAGMPPSLPEFDQLVADLKQDGIDALADSLAKAAASQGVPEVVAREAAKRAAEELVAKTQKSLASGGGAKGIWRVDPAGLYSPAVVVIEAENLDGSRTTEPTYAELRSISSGHRGTFRFTGARIPSLAPKRALLLSFELEPMVWEAGWMDFLPQLGDCTQVGWLAEIVECFNKKRGEAKAQLSEWTQLYNGNPHRFGLSLEVGGKASKEAILDCPGNAPTCSVTFTEPTWRGQRIDVCHDFAKSCGAPAATAFCKRMGYGASLRYERADNIGATTPTVTLGDGKTCDAPDCDGFASITCRP